MDQHIPSSDERVLMTRVVIFSVFAFTLIAGLAVTAASMRPTFMAIERQAFEQSDQRTSATISQISILLDEHAQLDVNIAATDDPALRAALMAQHDILTARIRREAQTLPADAIPAEARQFMY